MSPNFELIAHMLGDYYDLQADGIVNAENRFPLGAIEEQLALLGQLELAGNAVLANRIVDLTKERASLATQRDGLIDELNKTQDEVVDIKAQRNALAAQLSDAFGDGYYDGFLDGAKFQDSEDLNTKTDSGLAGIAEEAMRCSEIAEGEKSKRLGIVTRPALAKRVAELERDVSMHRNAEIMWEKTMMQAVGEDGPSDVIKAIDKIKAERDNAWRELREIREAINANPEESTADEVRRVMHQKGNVHQAMEQFQALSTHWHQQAEILAAQVSGLMKIVESNALVHISANTAEISAKAIEQAATYLSESIPDKSHESVIFKDGYVYISTRYLREHAEIIRQGGAA